VSRLESRLHLLVNLLVGGTGLVYLVMAWLLSPPDDWAVINHPWQPHVQHLHVLVAPLLVFAVGLLWRSHVLLRLREQGGLRPNSGALLLLLFVPMVLSGYALQVSGDQAWRDAWAWVHVISGGLWVLGFGAHQAPRLGGCQAIRGARARSARPSGWARLVQGARRICWRTAVRSR